MKPWLTDVLAAAKAEEDALPAWAKRRKAMKEEKLLDLVARLFYVQLKSNEKVNRYYVKVPSVDAVRLRDSIVALTEFVEGDCFCSGEGTPFFSECGPHVLLRSLDNPTPKEPGE